MRWPPAMAASAAAEADVPGLGLVWCRFGFSSFSPFRFCSISLAHFVGEEECGGRTLLHPSIRLEIRKVGAGGVSYRVWTAVETSWSTRRRLSLVSFCYCLAYPLLLSNSKFTTALTFWPRERLLSGILFFKKK